MNHVQHDYIKAQGSGQDFTVTITSKSVNDCVNYFEASQWAAKEIADLRQGTLYLMYSGGVDSEYTLSLFRYMRIPITPVVVKLLPDYNEHDVAYAFNYCRQHGIEPLVIDIDFDRFVESGQMYQLAASMLTNKFHYAATAHAIGQLDGTVICGEAEPYIRLDPNTGRWNLMVHEYEYALCNYFDLHNIHGTPHFNRYTKQMFYAFLMDSRIQDLAKNLVPGKTSSFSSKWIVYNRDSHFNLEERPKYHGYEQVERSAIFQDSSFALLARNMEQHDGVYSIDFLEFLEKCAP